MENNWLTILGFVAAMLTTSSFVPQVLKIWKTNDTKSISLAMFVLFTIGIACWLVYGYLKNDMAMTFANTLTLIMATYILYKKIRG